MRFGVLIIHHTRRVKLEAVDFFPESVRIVHSNRQRYPYFIGTRPNQNEVDRCVPWMILQDATQIPELSAARRVCIKLQDQWTHQ